MKTVIATPHAPSAIGPYSQAIVSGDLVFCSGQIGLDPKSMELVAGGVEPEAQQVLHNLGAVLAAAGCTFQDVVKTTIYLADMADFARVNALYAARFQGAPPARATVQAAGLPKNAKVEIDAIARKP